jgi:hypothetical protein
MLDLRLKNLLLFACGWVFTPYLSDIRQPSLLATRGFLSAMPFAGKAGR